MFGFSIGILCTTICMLLLSRFYSTGGIGVHDTKKQHVPYISIPVVEPEIWLFGYTLEDSDEKTRTDHFRREKKFEDDYASRNGSDYVINWGVSAFTIACQAEYPIMWTIPHKEEIAPREVDTITPILVESYHVSEMTEYSEKPESKFFRSYLTVMPVILDFLSTSFTCQSTSHPDASSESYFYIFQNHGIENQGKTIQVSLILEGPKDVILPCRPADPKAKVILERNRFVMSFFLLQNQVEAPNNRTAEPVWDPVPIPYPERYVTFNPKIGFKIERTYLSQGPTTLFKCSIDGEEDQYIFINVTLDGHPDKQSIEFGSHNVTEGNGKAELENSEFPDLNCCSGDDSKKPVVFYETCQTSIECDLAKFIAQHKIETENAPSIDFINSQEGCVSTSFPLNYAGSVIAMCKGDNVDFAEHYIHVFNAIHDHDDSVGHPSLGRKQDEALGLGMDTSYITTLDTWKLTSSRKMRLQLMKPVGMSEIENGELQAYDAVQMGDYSSPPGYPRDFWMEMNVAYHEDDVYEGETLIFACVYLDYFYSNGGHIRLNWKNGSRSVLEVGDKTAYTVFQKYHTVGDRFLIDTGLNTLVSKPVTAHPEMDSVDCFMSRWNSTEWDKVTYDLIVSQSVQPKFAGVEEETVYFSLNETGHQISCDIVEGEPFPRIEMSKDGKTIKGRMFPTENLKSTEVPDQNKASNRTLEFSSISLEMQGVYVCTAENVGGKAVKTVKVVVQENFSHTHATLISSCIVGGLCILILGLGIGYLLQKRKLQI